MSQGIFASRRLRPIAHQTVFALLITFAIASAASGQTWNEVGDAGDLPATAQLTTGAGPLQLITGTVATDTDADVYCIRITDLANLLIGFNCATISEPDVFLFDSSGKGVAAAQLCAGGYKAITSALVTATGTYYLAVAPHGTLALAGSDPIWVAGTTTQRAPDGPGAPNPVTGWSFGVPQMATPIPYRISLFGVAYCDATVPTHSGTWSNVKSIYRD